MKLLMQDKSQMSGQSGHIPGPSQRTQKGLCVAALLWPVLQASDL